MLNRTCSLFFFFFLLPSVLSPGAEDAVGTTCEKAGALPLIGAASLIGGNADEVLLPPFALPVLDFVRALVEDKSEGVVATRSNDGHLSRMQFFFDQIIDHLSL